MFRILVLAAVFSLLYSVPVFAEPNMKEGMWEVTMKIDMQGMPMPIAIPPTKYKQCITKKDMVPQQKEQNKDCKMVDTKVSGDTVSWVVKCQDKGSVVESNGKITYKGDKFDGVVNTKISGAGGGTHASKMNMSGRRIGDCK